MEPHSPKLRGPSADARPTSWPLPAPSPYQTHTRVESPRTAPLWLSRPPLPPLRVPPEQSNRSFPRWAISDDQSGPFQSIEIIRLDLDDATEPAQDLLSSSSPRLASSNPVAGRSPPAIHSMGFITPP